MRHWGQSFFAGVATFVLGVLLSRLEGSLEIGPTKLVAHLRAIARRDDLTSDKILDLLQRLLDVRGDPAPLNVELGQGLLEPTLATRLPEIPPFQVPAVDIAGSGVQGLEVAFEAHVAEAFRADGWAVDIRRRRFDFGFDFIATKEQRRVLVEVKLRRRVTAADSHSFVGAVLQRDDPAEISYVYAVNAGALSAAARDGLIGVPRVDLLEVEALGW